MQLSRLTIRSRLAFTGLAGSRFCSSGAVWQKFVTVPGTPNGFTLKTAGNYQKLLVVIYPARMTLLVTALTRHI